MPSVPMFDPPWVPQCSGSVQDPINEDQSVSRHPESQHWFFSVEVCGQLSQKMWLIIPVRDTNLALRSTQLLSLQEIFSIELPET